METILCFMFLTTLCVSAGQKNAYFNQALASKDFVCSSNEQVFNRSFSSLMVCLAECSTDLVCKSVALNSERCIGCSNTYVIPTELRPQNGFKIYNKANRTAKLGEDCGINPCSRANEKCEFDYSSLTFKCSCVLGSIGVAGTCNKIAALNQEICAILPCYGTADHVTCSDTGVCQCTGEAIYFPESGQCLIANVSYKHVCDINACEEPHQICSSKDSTCICNHGYTYNASAQRCVTECTTYGNTYQLYDGWRMLGHELSRETSPTTSNCEQTCSTIPTCRSFTFENRVSRCYFHDVTALGAIPFFKYRFEESFDYQHYIRNCL